MDAEEIKKAVAQYLTKRRRMAVVFEAGVTKSGKFRADVLAMNLRRNVVIVETKSGVQDFRSDKKAHNYLNYSTQAYFAMDARTYGKVKDEIPPEWGVFIVGELQEGKSKYPIRAVKPAKKRELDPLIILDLAVRMLYRNADATRYKNRKNKTVYT